MLRWFSAIFLSIVWTFLQNQPLALPKSTQLLGWLCQSTMALHLKPCHYLNVNLLADHPIYKLYICSATSKSDFVAKLLFILSSSMVIKSTFFNLSLCTIKSQWITTTKVCLMSSYSSTPLYNNRQILLPGYLGEAPQPDILQEGCLDKQTACMAVGISQEPLRSIIH